MEINYYYDDYCYRIKNKILNIYKFILKFIKEENNRNKLSHTNSSYLI